MEVTGAAERRRAARQRKILENAQNRMNRLYGGPDAAEPAAHTDGERTEPTGLAANAAAEHCPDPPDQSIHEVLRRSQRPAVPGWPAGLPSPAMADGVPPGMEDLLRQMNGQPPPAAGISTDGGPAPEISIWWQRWDNYSWIVVSLLAVITRLIVAAGLGPTLTQNVLVPFFVLETAVYLIRLWSVPLRANMGLLGTALMLCGVSPRTLDLWGRYITFLSHAWNDFMVYLFVLVVGFWCGSPTLAADAGTRTSDERVEMATPPPPDDHLEYEF